MKQQPIYSCGFDCHSMACKWNANDMRQQHDFNNIHCFGICRVTEEGANDMRRQPCPTRNTEHSHCWRMTR